MQTDAVGGFLHEAAGFGLELHSMLVHRRGQVIAEAWWAPYRRALPHMQHSLTKSFTATAVGLAVGEGRLGLDDRVAGFFPGPAVDAPARAMTVRDLLTMRTGHRDGISGSAWRQLRTSWAAAFLAEPLAEAPGTRFIYSSASSYMLSAIVQAVTGERVRDYLQPRLFEPLGMHDFTWDVSPEGISTGGNGLSCRTEDLLRFGQLHLQDGVWEGRRLLPEGWVREATRAWVADTGTGEDELHLPGARPPRGYGYQWWTGPDGAYYAAGLFGQYAIVMPRQEAVVAFTAALAQRDQRLMDLVWRRLQPGLAQAEPWAGRALALDLPGFGPASTLQPRVSGRSYAMEPNADGVLSIRMAFEAGVCRFTLRDGRGEHEVVAGLDGWVEGWTTMSGAALHHQYEPERMRVMAGGRWEDGATFVMTWQFVETAFRDRVACRFEGDGVVLERSVNVNTGALSRPAMEGRASPEPG